MAEVLLGRIEKEISGGPGPGKQQLLHYTEDPLCVEHVLSNADLQPQRCRADAQHSQTQPAQALLRLTAPPAAGHQDQV